MIMPTHGSTFAANSAGHPAVSELSSANAGAISRNGSG